MLAPSLYEAMLRSRYRARCFAPGNVRNVGYAVRTWMVRTAHPTCSALDPSRRDGRDACSRRRIDGDSPRFFRWASTLAEKPVTVPLYFQDRQGSTRLFSEQGFRKMKCKARHVLIVLWLACPAAVFPQEEKPLPPVLPWNVLLNRAANDSTLEIAQDEFVAKARDLLEKPLIRRVFKYEDIGKHRTWLDGRSEALEPEIQETFALAMSDFGTCRQLADELPQFAAAYRLTGEMEFRDRILAQLEEMTSWIPLQRPGWTLYSPGHRLPPDGKDGNWLATGCGVRAIGNTLALLPDGTLSEELTAKIERLLEEEIAGVLDDWETKRPWFVRSNNPITNQWVLPTEGLVRACLILGPEKHTDAYERGVRNLLMALNAHGDKGEFEEGFGYASFTVTSMLHAAQAMAVAGDTRAVENPFLRNFPTWLVHHFQPGGYVINCFDAGGSYNAAQGAKPLLSLLAICTGNPVARWALKYYLEGPSDDLEGLAAAGLPPVGPEAAPPLFAYYERATRVNWRSSWSPDATGVWVRGGHPLDQHDHQDRGHVNFIHRGRPILIEAGTPSYDHELMMTHYSTGAGHNVLQIGTVFPQERADAGKLVRLPGWQKVGGVAPIAVKRLDSSGGEASVDCTACYDGLTEWQRNVSWGIDEIRVADEVILNESEEAQIVLFRWHLGTEEIVTIDGEGEDYHITWEDASIQVNGSAPLLISQEQMPDNTLEGHDGSEDPKNHHTCLVVRSRDPVRSLELKTAVNPR